MSNLRLVHDWSLATRSDMPRVRVALSHQLRKRGAPTVCARPRGRSTETQLANATWIRHARHSTRRRHSSHWKRLHPEAKGSQTRMDEAVWGHLFQSLLPLQHRRESKPARLARPLILHRSQRPKLLRGKGPPTGKHNRLLRNHFSAVTKVTIFGLHYNCTKLN